MAPTDPMTLPDTASPFLGEEHLKRMVLSLRFVMTGGPQVAAR